MGLQTLSATSRHPQSASFTFLRYCMINCLFLHHLARFEIFTFFLSLCSFYLYHTPGGKEASQFECEVNGDNSVHASLLCGVNGSEKQRVNRFHILHTVISTLSRSAVGLINPQVASLSGNKSSDPLNKKTEGKGSI